MQICQKSQAHIDMYRQIYIVARLSYRANRGMLLQNLGTFYSAKFREEKIHVFFHSAKGVRNPRTVDSAEKLYTESLRKSMKMVVIIRSSTFLEAHWEATLAPSIASHLWPGPINCWLRAALTGAGSGPWSSKCRLQFREGHLVFREA